MMEVSTLTTVAFWVVSAVMLALSLIVVTQKDVFRAAIALAGTFLMVGVLYFILSAEFVGVVQILVYVGAISVLMAFAVMFIQDIASGSRPSQGRAVALIVAVLIFASLSFTAQNTKWSSMDDITNPLASAAMTKGYIELSDGEVIGIDALPMVDEGVAVYENSGVLVDSTGGLGVLLVREYILAFQIIGLLLVAALIGGLLLMRNPESSSETKTGDTSA
tara:strand:+ start:1097 stop:1756 length:660 start_codon:yes stop_codon:yes gene_type:complete